VPPFLSCHLMSLLFLRVRTLQKSTMTSDKLMLAKAKEQLCQIEDKN